MTNEMSRSRVNGFLDTQGRCIVNGAGEEVLLTGWGLGNWLLCEGYMWLADKFPRFDRPRRIETTLAELTGEDWARDFWCRFRDSYITERDLGMMAELGYNSVRIPLNARLFLREGPGLVFEEEGFRLLDRVLDWCERHRLYAFIDLHGAPGGQTGANIDDSIDDVCRLFMDEDQFEKGLSLWEEIARRYCDRWIVGGYDLLNEPLRPVRFQGDQSLEAFVPRLAEFYEKCIARIRGVDPRHLITLEGHHWATETAIFTHVYDPKMVIHFHCYGRNPDLSVFQPWLDLSEKLDVPLWLGETGENTPEWFSVLMPLAASLNVGFNMWPWKKMNCQNSPCSVTPPADWQRILDYASGGPHPGYEKARSILNEYLQNMLAENCTLNEKLTAHVFRLPGCAIAGTAFDELPGPDISYHHADTAPADTPYRRNTGMTLFCRWPDQQKRFYFDGEWSRYVLRLKEGEWACYSLSEITASTALEVSCYAQQDATVEVYQDGALLKRFALTAGEQRQQLAGIRLRLAGACLVQVKTLRGSVDIEKLQTASR